jgi:uncharacterized protein
MSLVIIQVVATASAATIKDEMIDGDPTQGFIMVQGDLEDGDADKFNVAIQKYSKGAVVFESGGGDLIAGLRIGETIRLKAFTTGVSPGALCASSCALAWLGGVKRLLSNSARLGFHAAYRLDGTSARETGMGNAIVGAYLTRIGLPLDAVIYITKAAPENMTWLTPDDAKKIGIDLSILEDIAPKMSHNPTAPPPPPSSRVTIPAPSDSTGPVLASPPTSRPSFDCSRAPGDAEKAICSDEILARADTLIASLLKAGKTQYSSGPEYVRRRLRLYNIYRETCHSDILCIISVQMMSVKIFTDDIPRWMNEYKSKLAQAGIGSEWNPVLPTKINQCMNTAVVDITDRFGANLTPLVDSSGFDSGSAANFKNGGFVVSYSKEPALLSAKRGDPVRMCLVSIPKNCPPGDNRGREYRIINLRTNETVVMSDSQHMCGGA